MWLLTTEGFYSIVQKPWDKATGTLTVRVRVAADLERLRWHIPSIGPAAEDLNADYRWRAQAPAGDVAVALQRLVEGIDYDNFKDAVKERLGAGRAELYHEVWDVLLKLQQGGAR